jgi:hypothetical protein
MKLHRLPFIISPWPNAALAFGMTVVIWYLVKKGHDGIPIVLGAVVGLVPALIDALTRSSMRSVLVSASNSADVVNAYRFPSLAGSRLLLGVALLFSAGYFARDYVPDSDAAIDMFAGFLLVHFVSHAILGFWTAWPTGDG